MRKIIIGLLLLLSVGASAQWQQTGSKVRYVNGLGIPTKDTAAGVSADSSQILIRPADSSLYIKYKRTWVKVGSGGTVSGTTNYIPKFTSSTAIGNSQIFDNGSNIAFRTTSVTYPINFNLGANAAIGMYQDGTQSTIIGQNQNLSTTNELSVRGANLDLVGIGSTYVRVLTNSVERLRIAATGGVSIGTTGNASSLTINGSGSAAIINGNGTSNSYIDFQNAGSNLWRLGNTYNGGTRLFQIIDINTSASAFSIASNGVIGINNASPTLFGNGGLVLGAQGTGNGKSLVINSSSDGNNGLLQFIDQNGNNSLQLFALTNEIGFYGYGSRDFIIYTNGTARVRTKSGGNVLINEPADNGVDRLQVNGSIQGTGFNQAYTAKTGTYTATTSDYFIDCTTGSFTVNLFTAVGNTGRILIIKNSGTGTITVDPNGTQTIDGATTQLLSTQWSRVHIISDGSNWKIISN